MDAHTSVGGELTSVGSWAENVEKALKFGALLVVAGLVVLGLAGKWGEDAGRATGDTMRLQQGKPVLQPLPTNEKVELFWNDPAMIQGGIRGVAVMGVLFLYVVLMGGYFTLVGGVRPRDEMLRSVSMLVSFPNSMAGFAVGGIFYSFYRFADGTALMVAGIAIVAGLATFFCGRRPALQAGLLCIQMMTLSYAIGVQRGVNSADFEDGHPLVEVQTVDGMTLTGLRMLREDDHDLHLVAVDGLEQLIPRERVRSARVVGR